MKKLVKSIKEIMKMLNPLKGEKTDKKIISEDGYYTNGVVAIKKGFDKKVDEDFKDADLMEKFNIKRLEKCMEYVAYNVVEKEKVVAIECAHSWKKDEKNKVMYMNAYTYRYLVRKDLKLKFNPDTFSYAGYIEGELMVYGLGMKVSEKHFEELETIEELKIRTEKENAEKKLAKEKMEEFCQERAKEIFEQNKKYIEDILAGYELKIEKFNKEIYSIKVFRDTDKNAEKKWYDAMRLTHFVSPLREQKRVGEILIEMIYAMENKKEKIIDDIVETVEELSWEIQAIDVVENTVYAEVKTKYGQFKVEGLYAGMEKTEKNWREDVDAVAVALGKKYNVEVRGIIADKVECEKREKEREEYIPQAIEKIREYNEDLLEEKEIIVTDIVNGDFGIEEVKRTTTTRQSDSLIEDFRYTFARQGKDVAFRRLDLLLSYLPKKELTQKKNNDNINITTNKQKAEEKEMDRIEMNNRKIGNAMNKLGKKLVAIKNDAQFEDKAFDIIKEIFPNACEIETAELEDVYFIAGVDYTGKAPTKKEMIKEDKHFKEVNEMYGLDIRFNVEKNKVIVGATVMVAYTDKWGAVYETSHTIKKVEIDFPEEVTKAGEVEKNKKEGGDTMKATAGIKRMGTAKYTHISNVKALELEELKMINKAFDLMKDKIEFMKDVCVLKVDLKNNKVTFIQSKDWNTAREPEVGDAYSIDLAKKEIKFIKAKGQIYHHKWSFVAEDYIGFDIEESKKWSEEWQEKLPKTREVKSRIGYKKYWEEYLEEYGLEVK